MTHIYREIQLSNYAVSEQGTIRFKIRVRHVIENPLTETGQPMTADDEPLIAWTEHDIFVQPKEIERAFFEDMERYHKYEYEALTDIRKYNLVTRLLSDAAFDDYDGTIGRIDLLDENNVRFMTFAWFSGFTALPRCHEHPGLAVVKASQHFAGRQKP